MSDIINDTRILSHLNKGSIKIVDIFASKTLFIDEDLSLPGLNLRLIAPNWEVIDQRKINLDGADGEPHSKDTAENGNSAKKDGEDGKPGFPGKPGGTFFGIGETFINGQCLIVTANGGNGGPGQHGGQGAKGDDGCNVELPINDKSLNQSEIEEGITNYKGFNSKKIKSEREPETFWSYIGFKGTYITAEYQMFGQSGTKGGAGGNGGVGGKGGNPGFIILHELDAESKIIKSSVGGKRGSSGRGSEGGLGGFEGNLIYARCSMYRPSGLQRFFGIEEVTAWNEDKSINNCTSSDSGRNGDDGANSKESQAPDSANNISESFKIVNKYKKFLMEQMICRFKRSSLHLFFSKLNENNVENIYNTIGFIEEYQIIEEEYCRSSLQQSHFIPIYQSILKTVSEYSKQRKNSKDDVEVLKILYMTILSKISILNVKSQTELIIDISMYLDMIKTDIKTLKELQLTDKKSSVTKKEYNLNMDKKIEKIESFIKTQVFPRLDYIVNEIDCMHLLVKTSNILQLEGKKELEDSLIVEKTLSHFRFIAIVLRFLVSVGSSMKSATSLKKSKIPTEIKSPSKPTGIFARVKSGSVAILNSVTASVGLDQNKVEISSVTVPNFTSIFELGEKGIENVINEASKFLINLMKVLSNEIKNYPAYRNNLMVIDEMQKRINNLCKTSAGLVEIKTLENNLKLELKKIVESLESQQGNQGSKDALQVISRLSKFAEFGSLILYFGCDNQNKIAKLDKLANAIEHSKNKLHSLKQFEEKIYNLIVSMIKNMEDNSFNTAFENNSNSQIVVDIRQWKVQSTLKNIQYLMKELNDGFMPQHKTAHCFDMLHESVTTIIKVYNNIENYYEQQTLANFVPGTNSVAVTTIDLSDQKLVKPMNYLNIALKHNLIFKHYKMALDAFNQWVFPFSQNYIEYSIQPHCFKSEPNLVSVENLVSECVHYIDQMKMNVEKYKTSIKINDEYFHRGEFNSRNISTKPFFVWENEKYKHLISRLLSGEQIVLKADVKKSPAHKDAIKFSFIEFHLLSKDESLQPELDQILKGFNIIATHMGNSYYRYANKIYLIAGDNQTIEYSFEKNAEGKSVQTNNVYSEIRRGDLMLSPYTVWQLELIKSADESCFNDLNVFKGCIDLELAGQGSYLMNYKHLNLKDEDYDVIDEHNEIDKYLD